MRIAVLGERTQEQHIRFQVCLLRKIDFMCFLTLSFTAREMYDLGAKEI